MQQSKYFAKDIPHPMYFDNTDENCKKGIFMLGWSNLTMLKWRAVTYRLFRELLVPLELILQHTFFSCASFLSDYLGNEKDNSTALFLRCKPAFNPNAIHKYVVWVSQRKLTCSHIAIKI